MERFDDSKDVGIRFARHRDQECGSCIHPRMDKVEVTKTIRGHLYCRHDYIALLFKTCCALKFESNLVVYIG